MSNRRVSGASSTEATGEWSERFCRRPRTPESECWALKIQRGQACLAHASDEERQGFFERVRSDPAAADWPSAHYFCNLDIDGPLYEQIRSLLYSEAYSKFSLKKYSPTAAR